CRRPRQLKWSVAVRVTWGRPPGLPKPGRPGGLPPHPSGNRPPAWAFGPRREALMAKNKATIPWRRGGATFTHNPYSPGHRWLFDGGVEVPASSSPQVVPVPMSVPAAVDPEEAFVAALASCHMLWFLSIAAKRGVVIEEYRDEAVGELTKDEAGKWAMTVVTLRPAVTVGGERRPSRAEIEAMHREAHEQCFIANSVRTDVRCEPAGLPE